MFFWLKNLRSQKFGPNYVGSPKKFCPKTSRVQKVLGPKNILCPKNVWLDLSDLTCPNFIWPVISWLNLSKLDLTCHNLTLRVLTWFDLIQIDLTCLDQTWPVLSWPVPTWLELPNLTGLVSTWLDLSQLDLTCQHLTWLDPADLNFTNLTCPQ